MEEVISAIKTSKRKSKHAPAADQIFDVNGAAEFLGCSVDKIYKRCTAKEIPHFKIGALRFSKNDLIAWLQSHKVEVKS